MWAQKKTLADCFKRWSLRTPCFNMRLRSWPVLLTIKCCPRLYGRCSQEGWSLPRCHPAGWMCFLRHSRDACTAPFENKWCLPDSGCAQCGHDRLVRVELRELVSHLGDLQLHFFSARQVRLTSLGAPLVVPGLVSMWTFSATITAFLFFSTGATGLQTCRTWKDKALHIEASCVDFFT